MPRLQLICPKTRIVDSFLQFTALTSFVYDAVYQFAYALEKVLDENKDPYDGSEIISHLLGIEYDSEYNPPCLRLSTGKGLIKELARCRSDGAAGRKRYPGLLVQACNQTIY